VLVAGGYDGSSTSLSSAEVFDPATNSFSSNGIGSMGSTRRIAAAAPLPDGRVLVVGNIGFSVSAEVFVGAPEPAGAGVDFGTETVSRPSAAQPLVITNLGAQALRIAGASAGGADPGDYVITADGCRGKVLAFRQSCSIYLRFTPAAIGSRPAALQLADNGGASPQSFALSGAGVAPNSGPKGDKGDRGARGPAGRDAKVTCKVKQGKHGKGPKVTCKVVLFSHVSRARVHWRLSRGGKIVAHGVARARHGHVSLRLSHLAHLRPGRYTLRIAGRRNGIKFVIG
jgi:hypothetical protein